MSFPRHRGLGHLDLNGPLVYICQACSVVVPSGTPRQLCVTETRIVRHPFRPAARTVKDNKTGKWKEIDDPGGIGTQIVSERAVCRSCSVTPPADPPGSR